MIDKPWGYEEILAKTDTYVMKKIVINEGCRISLQLHKKKTETWYIASGEGLIYLGNRIYLAEAGNYYHLPNKLKHRAGAVTGNLVIIEASTPELDDVIRLEDDYGRL